MKAPLLSFLRLAIALGASSTIAHAAPQTFDFKDPKGVNNVQFKLDAPLESISGTGTGISGEVTFDPSAPEKTQGRIQLDASSLTVGNPVMAEHLHGEKWLHVAQFATIDFELIKVENVRQDGNRILADARGKLTVKAVTKEMTVPVSFTYLADKLGARMGNDSLNGDLLVIRAEFEIERSDFNINPGRSTDKVAETIQISLSIAGASPRE